MNRHNFVFENPWRDLCTSSRYLPNSISIVLISACAYSSSALSCLLSSEPGLALDSARWVISLHTGASPHQIHTVRRRVSLQGKRPTIVPLVPPNGGANELWTLGKLMIEHYRQMVGRMRCVHFAQACVTRHSGKARKHFLE